MFVAMKPLFDDARWDAVPLSDTQARWGPDGVNTGDIVSLRKFVEERIYTVPEELEIWDQILLTVEGKIPDDIEYWQGRTPREEAVTWFLDVFCLGRQVIGKEVLALMVRKHGLFQMRQHFLDCAAANATESAQSLPLETPQMYRMPDYPSPKVKLHLFKHGRDYVASTAPAPPTPPVPRRRLSPYRPFVDERYTHIFNWNRRCWYEY